jgi:hypothetical protein
MKPKSPEPLPGMGVAKAAGLDIFIDSLIMVGHYYSAIFRIKSQSWRVIAERERIKDLLPQIIQTVVPGRNILLISITD